MNKAIDAASGATYIVGGWLVVGDWWLSILDKHAGAFGVMIALATFGVNLIFQYINMKHQDK